MDQFLENFIHHLQCPLTGSPLRNMQAEEIDKLNVSVQAGLTYRGR